MKTVITKYPLSTFLIILSFGLLTFTSLFSGLQEYLKLSGADYLRLSNLITMVITMVSMVLTGTLWLRVKIGHLLFYSSIPIGLIWSITEFVATLSNMGSEKELAMAVTNILLPAFISGLVCALAFFLTPRTEVTTHDDPEVPFKKLVIFFAIPFWAIVGMYATSVWHFDLLLNWEPAVILFCCLTLASVREKFSVDANYPDFEIKNFGGVMLDAGKVTSFIGAAIVALFYIAFSRLDAPKVLGPITAIGLAAILLGVMTYLAGLLLTITNERKFDQDELRLDAWHLAEAYAFVLLATVGPASLFDVFA
jgi:hypothetical protein